jgi:hypothetical protein
VSGRQPPPELVENTKASLSDEERRQFLKLLETPLDGKGVERMFSFSSSIARNVWGEDIVLLRPGDLEGTARTAAGYTVATRSPQLIFELPGDEVAIKSPLEIVIATAGKPDQVFDVTPQSPHVAFQVPEPLEAGKRYTWRVRRKEAGAASEASLTFQVIGEDELAQLEARQRSGDTPVDRLLRALTWREHGLVEKLLAELEAFPSDAETSLFLLSLCLRAEAYDRVHEQDVSARLHACLRTIARGNDLGENHVRVVVMALDRLASNLQATGQEALAAPMREHAQAIRARFPEDAPKELEDR